MRHDEIATIVVNTAFEIHRELGPGLLESVYREIMGYELRQHHIKVLQEVGIPVVWKNCVVDIGFRADFLIEDLVLVEIKAKETTLPVYYRQLLTYLKATKLNLGLLINFGEVFIRKGIKRVVNGLVEENRHAKAPSRQDAKKR
jgi:GxxExxY protein